MEFLWKLLGFHTMAFKTMANPQNASQKKKGRPARRTSGIISRLFRWSLWALVFSGIAGALSLVGLYLYMSKDLPKISSLNDYQPPIISTVYADDNRKIAEFYKERRIVLPLSDMPEMLLDAFIAAEDSRFYKHQGIDLISIARAFFKNLKAGTIVQGGSTITQQVTKSFLLTPERSFNRKIKEAILAYRIDKQFSKQDILYLYLNQIYLGHGAYGVEAASENYFGKSASDLDLAECAMLAGLPQAPSRYSPFKFPQRAKERQIYVLNRMVEEGFVTDAQAAEAKAEPLDVKARRNWYIEEVPYYTEYVRQYVEQKYGEQALYRDGLKIYTAVNIEMQNMAREEIKKGLHDLDRRQGYRGPLKHLAAGEIEAFSEALQAEIGPSGPEPGKTLQGVVLAVDDNQKTVTVRMGRARGVIELEDMQWARHPDPEVA